MEARSVLIGVAAGSALMFMLDPSRGHRRRALLRNKAIRATRMTREGLNATARDVAKRAGGIAAAAGGRWPGAEVSDEKLAVRVRAKLGRVCSHPHALHVDARDGQVTLRGPVLDSETEGILAASAAVRGVQRIHNEMEAHDDAEGIPALQDSSRGLGSSRDIRRRNWAPAASAMINASLLAAGVLIAVATSRASHELG